ncbi:hypothetical protein [Kosakonia radicincitans]|uniref:hypothetical protein n=1 Tax=Kosakonia radicincitans TaxID=283686 RepID=UPI0005C49CDA|nr:hypothetical protein [Kosakonia radicincitans]
MQAVFPKEMKWYQPQQRPEVVSKDFPGDENHGATGQDITAWVYRRVGWQFIAGSGIISGTLFSVFSVPVFFIVVTTFLTGV